MPDSTTTTVPAMKAIAARINAALACRDRAEAYVVTSTLAIDQLSSDNTRHIAQTLRDPASDEIWNVYLHLQAAMALIPEDDRPETFELDDSGAGEAPVIEEPT